MGLAHHAVYWIGFEAPRTDLLRKLGFSYRRLEEEGCRMPVAEAGCRYRAAARCEDRVSIEARVGEVGRARVRIDYTARNEEGKAPAEGFTVHAFLTPDMRPVRFPPELAAAMRADLAETAS
jgi:acyl-CoA thioester hydrolase